MTGGASPFAPLASLIRKAAVDAGYDLEPEREAAIDGTQWWRLRSSGAPGVVWVRAASPLPIAGGTSPTATLLALAIRPELEDSVSPVHMPDADTVDARSMPLGAAIVMRYETAAQLHGVLRRIWAERAHSPARLRGRWESKVVDALLAAGLPQPALEAAASTPLVTEAVAQVRRRVGQDLFREALLDFWEGRCAVTGLAVPELLRASHAKPWKDATDAERLDVHNGLLLAAHLDVLFDKGLLTFDAAGAAVPSALLTPSDWAALGLEPETLRLRRVSPAHMPYLAYHRAHVYRAQ